MNIGQLFVSVVPQMNLGNLNSQAATAGNQAGEQFSGGFGKSMKGLAKVAGAALASVGVASFGKEIIGLAANAEQSVGGVNAVFKDYAKTVTSRSKEADKALGLSANSYRELATVIGSQLKNAGVPMDQLAGKTDTLISQGADMAAMFGGTTEDAVAALSSALKGEMDPIEKYGISLNDAALKAEALALGVYNGTGPLDASAKQMAVMSLVTKQGADAQGAFGREADTAAGRAQRAAAQWENLKTTIGDQLLPAFTSVMGFVSSTVLPGLAALGPPLERGKDALIDMGEAIGDRLSPAIDFIKANATPILAGLGTALAVIAGPAIIGGITTLAGIVGGALSAAFAAVLSPVVLIGAAIGVLVFAFTKAYKESEPLRAAVDYLRAAFDLFFAAFKAGNESGGITGFFEGLLAGINAAFPHIKNALGLIAVAFWSWIKEATGPALAALGDWLASVAGWVINTGLPQLRDAALLLGGALIGWIGENIGPALSKLGEWGQALYGWLIDTGLPLLQGKLKTWGSAIWQWIVDHVPAMLTAIAGFANSLASWVIDTGLPLLLDKMKEWGAAIWEWIGPRIPDLLGALGGFLGEATGWLVGTGLPLLVGAMLKLAWELVKWIAPRIPDLLAALGDFLWSATNWVVTKGIPTLVTSMYEFGKEALLGFGRSITDSPLVQKIGDFFSNIASSAKEKFSAGINGIKSWINENLIAPLEKVTQLFGVTIPRLNMGGAAGSSVNIGRTGIQAVAGGGLLHGPGTGTSDSILGLDANGIPTARVSAGEYVVNAKQTKKHLGLLEALNAGKVPGFAVGGKIGEWLKKGASFAAGQVLDPAAALINRLFPSPELVNKAAVGSVNTISKAIKDWVKKKEEEAVVNEGPARAPGGGGISAVPGGGSQANLMAFAYKMISMGARVTEHPNFGRVGRHSPGSKHYVGRAVDVNFGPGGQNATEMAFFDRVVAQGLPRQYGLRSIWRAPGHYNHLHADYDQGGWLRPGSTMSHNKTGQPEAVLTNPQWDKIERLIAAVEASRATSSRSGPLIGQAVIRETVDADLIMARLEHRVRMARV
jgi:hypothetical protein